MDGFETARRIRRLGGESAQVRIVAMTGSRSEQAHAKAREAGMNDLLMKPFGREALLALLTV